MLSNLSILNFITAVLGFAVSFILIFSNGQNRFANFFLGGGFFVIAYRSFSIYALQQNLVNANFIIGPVSFIYYLIGPMIYLYFRSVIEDKQSLKKHDWIHFILPSMAIILLIYYLICGVFKFGYLKLPISNAPFGNDTGFDFYVQPGQHALLLLGTCAFYLILSWREVFIKLKRTTGEHPQVNKIRTWLVTLLVIFSLLILVVAYGAILNIFFKRLLTPIINLDLARSFILVFIFTRVLFKRDLLYGIPDLKTGLPIVDMLPSAPLLDSLLPDIEAEMPATFKKYTQDNRNLYFDEFGWIHLHDLENEKLDFHNIPNASIEKDKVIDYIKRIGDYLKTAPYRNPDFDLKAISEELHTPLYHIEYLFRYYNKYSFSEFRNLIRVQHVLKEMDKGISHNFTIEAVGLEAGFNSRSSFFRVFKAVTGKTPKQALEELEIKG